MLVAVRVLFEGSRSDPARAATASNHPTASTTNGSRVVCSFPVATSLDVKSVTRTKGSSFASTVRQRSPLEYAASVVPKASLIARFACNAYAALNVSDDIVILERQATRLL